MNNKDTKAVLNDFKMEVASELGVDLSDPDITSKDAGRVGGQMVKKIIESYENSVK